MGDTLCMSSRIILLKNYIVTVCPKKYIGSVRVYDIKAPLDLLMLMTLDEINDPRNFVPSVTSECLYVTDFNSSCIWKITIEDLQLTKWLCNLKRPMGVTVTTDGQVVVAQYDPMSDKQFLDIYGSDAVLVHRLYLSNDFCKPGEAILTPDGQFITIYRSHTWGWNYTLVISLATIDGKIISQVNVTGNGFNSSSDELCWSFHSNDAEVNDFEYKSECIVTHHFTQHFNIMMMLEDFTSNAINIWSRNGYGRNEIFLMYERLARLYCTCCPEDLRFRQLFGVDFNSTC